MTNDTTDTCAPKPEKDSVLGTFPVEKTLSFAFVMTGLTVLAVGLVDNATAQIGSGAEIHYNGERLTAAVNAIMTYLEGAFGALIMASAGVGAIMSAAFGQYKASLSLLVVAVGSFILRSLIGTFFNDDGIQA